MGALRSRLSNWRHGPQGLRAVKVARLLRSPAQLVLRRRAARSALASSAPPTFEIDERLGYALFQPGELPGVLEVLEHVDRVLARLEPHIDAIVDAEEGGRKLTVDLFSDDLLRDEREFVEFALGDEVLLPTLRYLGTVPYLARIVLAISIHMPELVEPTYHQRYHVDNDDLRVMRVYVHANEVTREDGPLCFLPAHVTTRILRELRRGRPLQGRYESFSDEEVFEHCDPSEVIELTGPRGAGAFVDLARCMHQGSRVGPGGQRRSFALSFHRYHRVTDNASNRFDPEPWKDDPLRSLVMTPPRLFPHGYFCPDPLAALRASDG